MIKYFLGALLPYSRGSFILRNFIIFFTGVCIIDASSICQAIFLLTFPLGVYRLVCCYNERRYVDGGEIISIEDHEDQAMKVELDADLHTNHLSNSSCYR